MSNASDVKSIANQALHDSNAWWRLSFSAARIAETALRTAGTQAREAGDRDVADMVDMVLEAAEPLKNQETVRSCCDALFGQYLVPVTLLGLLQDGLRAAASGVPGGCCGLAGLAYFFCINMHENLRADHYDGRELGMSTSPVLAEIVSDQMLAVLRKKAAAETPGLEGYIDGWSAMVQKAAYLEHYDAFREIHEIDAKTPADLAREAIRTEENAKPRIPEIFVDTEVPWARAKFVRGCVSALSAVSRRAGNETLGSLLAVRSAAQGLLPSGPAGDATKDRFLGDTPALPQVQLDRSVLWGTWMLTGQFYQSSDEEAQRLYGQGWQSIAAQERCDAINSQDARKSPDRIFSFMSAQVDDAWKTVQPSDWRQFVETAEAKVGRSLPLLRILVMDRLRRDIHCDALSVLETVSTVLNLYVDPDVHKAIQSALEASAEECAQRRAAVDAQATIKVDDRTVTIGGVRVERRERSAQDSPP